ncbi:MAG: hypothetical protein K8R77_04015 [Anaerolineaceae bacterium]|nr:hypothetical protein [Anaerolineaceae bacterium]
MRKSPQSVIDPLQDPLQLRAYRVYPAFQFLSAAFLFAARSSHPLESQSRATVLSMQTALLPSTSLLSPVWVTPGKRGRTKKRQFPIG